MTQSGGGGGLKHFFFSDTIIFEKVGSPSVGPGIGRCYHIVS